MRADGDVPLERAAITSVLVALFTTRTKHLTHGGNSQEASADATRRFPISDAVATATDGRRGRITTLHSLGDECGASEFRSNPTWDLGSILVHGRECCCQQVRLFTWEERDATQKLQCSREVRAGGLISESIGLEQLAIEIARNSVVVVCL